MPTIDALLRETYTSWDDAKALTRLGCELQDRNRLPFAREALERALELDPKGAVEAWIWLAFAHFRDFRTARGYETLRAGIEATGADELRSTLMSFSMDEEERKAIRDELADTEDPAAKADLEFARFHEGDDDAVGRMRELAAAHPDSRSVRNSLAFVLLAAKRAGRAGVDVRETGLPLVEAMIRDEPDRIGGYTLKIQMLEAEEDHDGALAATAEALARFPDDETVMQMRGRAYERRLDHERARHWYARAIGAKPGFAGARRDLGKLWEKEGKLDLAEEVFREIPAANPDYPVGPMSLALFLARHERWEEAEEITRETWPKLPAWAKGSLQNQPDATPLLAREALKDVVSTEE